MGDYVDWDYSETLGGVPASLVAYTGDGARKRRAAQSGFDTSYGDPIAAGYASVSSQITKLQTQMSQYVGFQQQVLKAANVNMVANGDFSQWSAMPTIWGGFNLSTGTQNHLRMNGYAIPLADRWYHVAQTGAFVLNTAGIRMAATNPVVVQNAVINPDTAVIVQSKKALQVVWTSTNTVSLYSSGDNYLRSSAMFAVQHMIQDVTRFVNKQMSLVFKVKGVASGTGFVQIYRQYNLTRPTPTTTSATTFAQTIKPPGLELIKRQQFTYTALWSQQQVTFDLGGLLGTTIADGDNGLVIQIGSLFYYNTRTSGGALILEQFGDAGGANGLFKTGGGSVTLCFADVMVYEGGFLLEYSLRDERPYTQPWVCSLGPKAANPAIKRKVLAKGQTANVQFGQSPFIGGTVGGNWYQSVFDIKLPLEMARAPTNLLWFYQNFEASGVNANLTLDGWYGDPILGTDADFAYSYQTYETAGGLGRMMSQGALGWGIYLSENWADGTTWVNRYQNMSSINAGTIRYGYCLQDSDRTKVQLLIGANSASGTYMPSTYIGGGSSTLFCADSSTDSWRSWMVFYAKETSWGPVHDWNPNTDTEALYYLNSATTSFVFPSNVIT